MFKDANGMIRCPRRGLWEQKRGNHGGVKNLRRGSRMKFKTHERNRPLIERRHFLC